MFKRTMIPSMVATLCLCWGMKLSANCLWYCRNDIAAEYRNFYEYGQPPLLRCVVFTPTRDGLNLNDLPVGDRWTITGEVSVTAYEISACTENCWVASGPVDREDAYSNLGTEDFDEYGTSTDYTGVCDTVIS